MQIHKSTRGNIYIVVRCINIYNYTSVTNVLCVDNAHGYKTIQISAYPERNKIILTKIHVYMYEIYRKTRVLDTAKYFDAKMYKEGYLNTVIQL